MLFNATETTEALAQARPEAQLGAAFRFDWDNHCYFMASGSPEEVTETEAVKEWIRQVLRTRRGRYGIYHADFGAPAQDLIGRRIPKGFDLSELRRQLSESAVYNPAIREIGTMAYDGRTITCTVTLETADGETQEVIEIEPEP